MSTKLCPDTAPTQVDAYYQAVAQIKPSSLDSNPENPKTVNQEIADIVSAFGSAATVATVASSAIIPVLGTQTGALAKPLITMYMFAAVAAAIQYGRSGKPGEPLRGVGPTRHFTAKVLTEVIRVGPSGRTWKWAPIMGVDHTNRAETMVKWAFMTTYSGGRALFGDMVGVISDPDINANVAKLSTLNPENTVWSDQSMTNFLAELSSKTVGTPESLIDRIVRAPLLALVAVGLIFTVGARSIASGSVYSSARGGQLNQASPMITEILSGFSDAFQNYKGLAGLLPALILVKTVGPIASAWITAAYMTNEAKMTQNDIAVVLNPSSTLEQAARWVMGVLPTTSMTMGYKAQIRLNLTTQLLLMGGGLVLYNSNDPRAIMKLARFAGMVFAVRIVAWLAWYGYTTIRSVTTGTTPVVFQQNGSHIIKNITIGGKTYSNIVYSADGL